MRKKYYFKKFLIFVFLAISFSKFLHSDQVKAKPQKNWNFLVYIAANNDLNSFSLHNIKQMVKVGSTNNINILVQLDKEGAPDIKRYYIKKDQKITEGSYSFSKDTITGTPDSLFKFVQWAVEKYPAKHQCLVLWNHGSGIKDPSIWGRALINHRDRLFHFNPETGLLELNRHNLVDRIGNYMQLEQEKRGPKGIAFNDTFEEYLTNQDLEKALKKISADVLGGNKIDLLCMDACHMAMLEIGSQVKASVKYIAASEEVEPGNGYNYIYLLKPFKKQTFTPAEFAIQAVKAYEKEYKDINAEYTQSAINLRNYEKLEDNVKQMTEHLVALLDQDEYDFKFKILKKIRRSRKFSTVFCDYDYIDFGHFYKSLAERISEALNTTKFSNKIRLLMQNVSSVALQGLNMMQNYIISNASGVNLPDAYGLSFYFPSKKIHKSYYKTIFDKKTGWSKVLKRYLQR